MKMICKCGLIMDKDGLLGDGIEHWWFCECGNAYDSQFKWWAF